MRRMFPKQRMFPMRSQAAHTARAAFLVCGSLFLSGEGIQAPHTPRGEGKHSPLRKRDPHTRKAARVVLSGAKLRILLAEPCMRLFFPLGA